MNKVAVGVLGASGYAGRELAGLVLRHPRLTLVFASAHERAGASLDVAGRSLRLCATDEAPLGDAALVFTALPHGGSASWVERARAAGAMAVDLSADLRPGGGASPPSAGAPYGLTELSRAAVRRAEVVANPGCYPTAVLLALAPLAMRGLIRPGGTVTVNAASGVTGAGTAPRHDLMFGEVTEDFRPYAVGNTHRHLAEMRSVLAGLGADCDLLFTPHLLPVARGLLATITVPLTETPEDLLAPWREQYCGEPFVEIIEGLPTLRAVVRRNVVQITARRAEGVRVPTITVLAAIDNLVKGAAGQALQNANLMLGLDECAGLPS